MARFRIWFPFTAVLVVATAASGQEPGAVAPAGVPPPGAVPAGEAAPLEESLEAARYGILVPETLQLRCFPTDHSPTFAEDFSKGQPVRIGPETYESYVQAFLPLGVVGYVHKDFTAPLTLEGEEAGIVRTTVNRVSFRYRPASSEPPVVRLPKEAALTILGEEGDWWRVRHEGTPGWIKAAAVQLIDPPTETLLKSWEALQKAQETVAAAVVEERLTAQQEAAALKMREERLVALRRVFAEAVAAPAEEHDYQLVEAALDELLKELPEESVLRRRVLGLKVEIDEQRWVDQAVQVIGDRGKPAGIVEQPPPPVDGLRHYTAIGWLRYHPRSKSYVFSVEKGGQTLYWLTCSDRRYDLRLFEGAEVGVSGNASRPHAESLRVLDVTRLEVLGTRTGS